MFHFLFFSFAKRKDVCHGGSLESLLADRDQNLDDRDVASIATNVAGAMRVLHDAGILHLDLAARNALVYKRNPIAVKVCDFGLSVALTHKEQAAGGASAKGRVFSARWYEAPANGLVDFAADVYGFGSFLYEVITRRKPWNGVSAEIAALAIMKGRILSRPDPIEPVTATMLNRIYNISYDCWRPKRDKRPTFEDLVLTLRGITYIAEASYQSKRRRDKFKKLQKKQPIRELESCSDDSSDSDDSDITVDLEAPKKVYSNSYLTTAEILKQPKEPGNYMVFGSSEENTQHAKTPGNYTMMPDLDKIPKKFAKVVD